MQDRSIEIVCSQAKADGDKITLTCGQLEPKLYKAVDALFKRFRGKWKGGRVQAHVFPFPIQGQDVIDSIAAGEIPPKNPYSLFPTPDHVVDEMMREVYEAFPDRDANLRFLEPSAGTGVIASQLRHDYPNAIIDCVEIDPINVRILNSQGFDVIHDDFMSFEPEAEYDAVVMNPPFRGTTYVDHIMQSLGMVDSDGLLVSIAPGGIAFGNERSVLTMLEILHERSGTIEELPAESFKKSGTTVATYLMSMRGSPPDDYLESRIETMMILVGNDFETYDRLREVVEPDEGLCERFKRNVRRLYSGYLDRERLNYFIQPTDQEWEIIYSLAAESFELSEEPDVNVELTQLSLFA